MIHEVKIIGKNLTRLDIYNMLLYRHILLASIYIEANAV